MAEAGLGGSLDYPVYLGVWTNWSLGGRVTGSIITLTHRNGALLTAFLAIFVTFSGSRLWRLSCFALYQFLTKPDISQDGLYHQRQAILRNATDSTSGSVKLLQSFWAWRLKANHPRSRVIPIILFSIFMTAALAAASLLSSKISSIMGNEVLIASPQCGLPEWTAGLSPHTEPTPDQAYNVLSPWYAEKATSYANYAQRCYSSRSTRDACAPFVQRQLLSSIDRNASCPFKKGICRHENSNIYLDTGHLNSQADLGINGPVDFQFTLRIITHCAPILSRNHEEVVKYSEDKPYVKYLFGPRTFEGNNLPSSTNGSQTYEVEQQSADELKWQARSSSLADYALDSEVYRIYNRSAFLNDSSFRPITELTLDDSDTALVFLSANRVIYTQPVEDDWYAAHQKINDTLHGSFLGPNDIESLPIYLADEPASVLGCKMSYQTCDPALSPEKGCTPPSGRHDIDFSITQPRTRRDKILRWFWSATGFDINLVIVTLKASSLTSRFRLYNQFQGSIPVNQWQQEVENWHNITLALFQGLIVDAATGSENPEMLQYFWTPPNNTEERYLCQNQKIISTAYANFSLLWLVVLLVTGLIIVLLEFSLESIVVFCERHGIIKAPGLEWFSNETLQLQRMAHEELGLGGVWSGCTGPGSIPVTDKGELLGVLDISDREHPRLVNIFNRSALSMKSGNDVYAPTTNRKSDSANGSSRLQNGSEARQGSGTVTMLETINGDNDDARELETHNSGSCTVKKVETNSKMGNIDSPANSAAEAPRGEDVGALSIPEAPSKEASAQLTPS